MNTQMKNFTLVLMTALLLTACGQVDGTPADAPEAVPTAVDVPAVDSTDPIGKYIGLNYPPFPAGLTERFAMLIQDREEHSLSLITEGPNVMLWLGRMTHLDSDGNAFWEVMDVLDLSDLESGLILLPDGCWLNGPADSEILALGRNGVLLFAWRANTTWDAFEVIPAEGIECQSDKAWNLE